MATGREHGMSKLLRVLHMKDKPSQDVGSGSSGGKSQYKVEPFGQAAPGPSSRPFNPTASAPAASYRYEHERSRTPPHATTSFGHVASTVSDGRRAGTPPYASLSHTASTVHRPARQQQHQHAFRRASPSHPTTNAPSHAPAVPQTAPHHVLSFGRPGSPPLPTLPPTSAPHHTTSFGGTSAAPPPGTLRTAHSRPAAFHRPTASAAFQLHQPFGPDAHHHPRHPARTPSPGHFAGQPQPYASSSSNRSASDLGQNAPNGHSSSAADLGLANGYHSSVEDLSHPPSRSRTPLHFQQQPQQPSVPIPQRQPLLQHHPSVPFSQQSHSSQHQHQHSFSHQQQPPHLHHHPSLPTLQEQRQFPPFPSQHQQHPSLTHYPTLPIQRRHPSQEGRARDATPHTPPASSSTGSSRSDPRQPLADDEQGDLVRRDPFAARDQLHQHARVASLSGHARSPPAAEPRARNVSPSPRPVAQPAQSLARRPTHATPPSTPPPTGALPPTPPPGHQRHPSTGDRDRAPTPKRGLPPANITTSGEPARTKTLLVVSQPPDASARVQRTTTTTGVFSVASRRGVPQPSSLQPSASGSRAGEMQRSPVPPSAATPYTAYYTAHPTPPLTTASGSFVSLLPPQTPRSVLSTDASGDAVVGGRERPLPPVPRSPHSADSATSSPAAGLTAASAPPLAKADKILDISHAAYEEIKHATSPAVATLAKTSTAPMAPSPLAHNMTTIPPSPHGRRASFHLSTHSPRRNVFFADDTYATMSPGAAGTLMTPYSAKFSAFGTPFSAKFSTAGTPSSMTFGSGDESPLGPPPSVTSEFADMSPAVPVRPVALRGRWAPSTPQSAKVAAAAADDGAPKSSVSSPSPLALYPPAAAGPAPARRPTPRRRASSLDSGSRPTTPAGFKPEQVPVYSLRSQPDRPRKAAATTEDIVIVGGASAASPALGSAVSNGSDRSIGKLSIDTSFHGRSPKRMSSLPATAGEMPMSSLATADLGQTEIVTGLSAMLPSALQALVMPAHPVTLGVASAAAVRLSSLNPPVRRETASSSSSSDAIYEEEEDLVDSPDVKRHPHHPRKTGSTGRRAHPKSRTVTTLWTELWHDVHTHGADGAGSPPPVPLATIANGGPRVPTTHGGRPLPANVLAAASPMPLTSGSSNPVGSPALPTLDFGSPLSVTFDGGGARLSMGSIGGIFLSPAQSAMSGPSHRMPFSSISPGAESSRAGSVSSAASSPMPHSAAGGGGSRSLHAPSPRIS